MYLATGSTDKLIKMQKIADARGDPMSRFHNALYAGDVLGRIAVLKDVGMCTSHAPDLDLRAGAFVRAFDQATSCLAEPDAPELYMCG